MKTYGQATTYKRILQESYAELRELQDWGLPLPRSHYSYYNYLLVFIPLVKSRITENTD